MIQRLVPIMIFAAVAIVIIQLINRSFTQTYKSIEASIKTPHIKAQQLYEAELVQSNY